MIEQPNQCVSIISINKKTAMFFINASLQRRWAVDLRKLDLQLKV